MSDSESSEEIEVKVELQHEAKVRELIEKGKTILPYYSVPLPIFRKNPSFISISNPSRMRLISSISCTSSSGMKSSVRRKVSRSGSSTRNIKKVKSTIALMLRTIAPRDRDTIFWKIRSVRKLLCSYRESFEVQT